jgi:hypothetical protein
MHLKIRLKGQWQVTRDPALKARVNRLQRSVTYRLNKWRNEQWSDVLESPDSADQSLWKLTKRVMRVPTPLPPLLVPGGLALSDSEKAEALADSLEAQFQPVNDPSSPAVIEAVDEVMRAYKYAPASELKLTSPSQVQEAVQGLEVGKAPGPNGVLNRALTHLPKREITFLMKLFNAVLRRQYFPPAWKHARVISILKPEKDPTLPSSYRPISLLDTVGKLFEKILLTRVLREVNERGLLRDEQFGFRPRHSTALQLARLVERVNRNFDERRLSGAVFLDVAKAFGNVWVEGLLYKLAILNFPFYLVKTLSSYLHLRTFQTSFKSATPTRRTMRAGVAQGGLVSPVLFSPYVNDIPTPSRHVELALYADDTALIATSRSPLLLVTYLETYLNRLEIWLRDWRIAINVSKSTEVLFTKTTRRVQRPRPPQLFGKPIEWGETARYLGVTFGTRLTWSAHVNQVRKKAVQRLGLLSILLNRSGLSIRNGVLLYKQLIRPMMDYACPIWRSAVQHTLINYKCLQSKCLRVATNAPWNVGNKQIHEDLGIPFFTGHMRAMTESFDSKLADVWKFGNLEGTYANQGQTEVTRG